MIVYGRNPVQEALRGLRRSAVTDVWATAAVARAPWLAQRGVQVTDAAALQTRCGSAGHQGVCAEVGPYPYEDWSQLLANPEPMLLALDQVQDPQNLGALCRTAECAGVAGIVIPERRSAEVTAAVCKASAGAVEHLRIARVRNLADFLGQAKRAGCWCYGAAAGASVPYEQPDYNGPLVLVLGGEADGLRVRVAGACDALIGLPLRGRVQSLNVSAAGAILMYSILQAKART
jgi:23S rRNA (guanosine2251-2'-O)-methyltransferase